MILTLFAVVSAAIGLSGRFELSSAKDRYRSAVNRYELLMKEAEEKRAALDRVLMSLGDRVLVSRKLLRRAQHILSPTKRLPAFPYHSETAQQHFEKGEHAIESHQTVVNGLAAVGSGAGLAVGSWAAVSMLGMASTGTAIGTLHGAALTNATLAWMTWR